MASAEDAWTAAREIGGPVVVKPRDGNHGRGVALNLRTREEVTAAFEAALPRGRGVIVERYVPGVDHRLLVVGGKLAAAARWEPSHVLGDGRLRIDQLVARRNAEKGPAEPVALDPELLAEQGFEPGSVPPPGVRVMLGRRARFYDGGVTWDVTTAVHPDIAALAERAAGCVGLDVAGIDVVARDISRPLEEQGGAFVEMNAGPGLQMHLPPSGPPTPVGRLILAALFPEGEDGRIPLIALAETPAPSRLSQRIARILHGTGRHVGRTGRDGIDFDGRSLRAGDRRGYRDARDVLRYQRVEAAVLESSWESLRREGLAFDRCDVAVVTHIGAEDRPDLPEDLRSPEGRAAVARVLVASVRPGPGVAVLNAADPRVVGLAESCPGSVLFFADDGGHAVLKAHRARGGRAAFLRDGIVVLAEGDREDAWIALADVTRTETAPSLVPVEDVLAAAAVAGAMGLPRESARAVLSASAGGQT